MKLSILSPTFCFFVLAAFSISNTQAQEICPGADVLIHTEGMTFTPDAIEIVAGTTVGWVNTGGMHDANGDISSIDQLSFNNPEAFDFEQIDVLMQSLQQTLLNMHKVQSSLQAAESSSGVSSGAIQESCASLGQSCNLWLAGVSNEVGFFERLQRGGLSIMKAAIVVTNWAEVYVEAAKGKGEKVIGKEKEEETLSKKLVAK